MPINYSAQQERFADLYHEAERECSAAIQAAQKEFAEARRLVQVGADEPFNTVRDQLARAVQKVPRNQQRVDELRQQLADMVADKSRRPIEFDYSAAQAEFDAAAKVADMKFRARINELRAQRDAGQL